ncbi:MAG: ATP synthase F1 subunit epsilon [Bdellovibrionales bacterium]|nr:ATP synthase F1 subunit epsilon [Bdellovibrionales bacterium]NQZ17794.1 ATP synthase F1 subunit epsilon [Bdellovibrionales bacterium]
MFEITVVTPTKKLLANAEVEEVFVPAFRGQLNILPNHSPLVSTLTEGVLRYKLKGEAQETAVAISWGYVEVTPKGVQVLAETAESKEEIDLSRAEEAIKKVDSSISKSDVTPEDIEKLQRKRRRAEARIAVAKNTFH